MQSKPKGRWQPSRAIIISAALVGSLWATQVLGAEARVLWEDRVDAAGGDDAALNVIQHGGRAFAAGYTASAFGDLDFTLRAYDARGGALLWEERLDGAGATDVAYGLAVTGNRLIAVGTAATSTSDNDWLVRAYAADDGTLIWEDQFDRTARFDSASDIAVLGSRVFVGGVVRGVGSGLNFNWLLRAYNATSGVLLWEDEVDGAGGNDQLLSIAVAGGRIFAAGWLGNAQGDFDLVVRSYDADGTLLWEDRADHAGGNDFAIEIDAGGGRVAVAGSMATDGGADCVFGDAGACDFAVRTYDAATGRLIWQDVHDVAGGNDLASDVAVHRDRVYVSGRASSAAGDTDFLVRAYDARSGGLLWQDLHDSLGGDDVAFAIAAKDDAVYVGGETAADTTCVFFYSGNCDFTVRAYDANTGALLWDDRVAGAGGNAFLFDLDDAGADVLAAGRVPSENGDQDFLIRVYDGGGRGR